MLNEQVESVMAIAFELARIREEHGAQSGMYLSEVRALRAESERLAAQAAPFKREDLTLAAVNCEHQIDADCVRLWRDETKEGTALSQLVDRVAAVVAQSVPDLDTMRADFHQWCATNGYKTGFVNGGECPMGRPVYEDHRTHAAWWAFQKAAKLYGAQSAQPDAGEVRMLTKVEVVEVVRTTDPGIALLNALQRAFCKANAGKRIPVDGEVRS